MSRQVFKKDMTTFDLPVDTALLETVLGHMLYFGPTDPVAADGMAPGSIWEDSTNKVVKVNTGTKASPTWTSLAAGSTATALAASVTIDGTTNDLTLITSDQLTGVANITIPDIGGNSQIMAFVGFAQTWTAAQTFGKADIHILDTDESHDTIITNGSALSADRTFTLTHKDANTIFTLANDFITVGDNSLTLTTTGATDVTLPTTGTLVSKASTDILTNKSYDCDGAGNVLTNLNADELDPTTLDATSAYAIPFVIHTSFANLPAAGTNIYADNAPFAFKVLDAWSVNTSVTGGTWAIHKGKVGVLGNAIISAVTVAGNDKDIDRATDLDDAEQSIAASGSLVAVGDGANALDCQIHILCIRTD